jgi:hypothetical protein
MKEQMIEALKRIAKYPKLREEEMSIDTVREIARAALSAVPAKEPRAWLVRERSKRTGLLSNEILVESKNHFIERENFKYEFVPLYAIPPAQEGE